MSVPKIKKQRGQILDEIMRYHREQLPRIMRNIPAEEVRAFASVAPPPLDFYTALATSGVSLIAECKKASPSKGLMVRNYDPVELAKTYVKAGASAISILTDGRHFQGTLEHLRDVREHVPGIPLLRKDFMFHPYQIYEARAAGADCILLIAAVLSNSEIASLMALAHKLKMNALVEVHTEDELDRMLALEPRPRIIGVNNRNLQTFKVDFENTARLRDKIPSDILVVGESGLKTNGDVATMQQIGVDAILVGETLVRSRDTFDTARQFVLAGRPN